jgi:predicted transglutaminase-like cysteine proteinase
MTRKELYRAINEQVNRETTYVSDAYNYDTDNFWAVADGKGDCEDYALRKRQLLMQSGVPVTDLRLCCCWTETKDYHAVLFAKDEDGNDWILDNRFPNICTFEELKRIGYVFDVMQIAGTTQWEYVDNDNS